MTKLSVAIVGCGRISAMYKGVFQELKDEVEVKWAVDIKKDRAEAFAEGFANCKVSTDYRDCLEAGDIDVIHIATSHDMHPVIAIDAMKRGIHVLTEKPMAITLDEADDMIKTAEETNVKLGVIFQTRYVKGCMDIKKLVDEGKLGKIIAARSYLSWSRPDSYYAQSDWKGTWDKEGGGVLIDQAIHSIDRTVWLIGDEIEWIEGTMGNRGHAAVNVEDVAEAAIKFKNGCLYHLFACNYYSYDAPIQIEIVGEKGKAGLTQDLAWVHLDGEERYEIKDGYDGLSVGPSYWGSSHVTQVRDFYKSVREDLPVTIDGVEGRYALEVIKGIYISSNTRQRVHVPFKDQRITEIK
ncbi:MAG: Gfo/Idh/MocA family oxidoreductase [Firmicutes bacterium]|nr:Gfo/Idh/MocA family oxidoreductase [Bacillota bacterium]